MQITLRDVLKIPVFHAFEEFPHKLASLMNRAQIEHFVEGDVIINEGDDDGGALYIVVSGSVMIAKIIDEETKRAKPLATLHSHEYFGEMSLFDNAPRSAAVIAQDDCYLIKISREVFQELVLTDVEVASRLLFSVINVISGRLRKTNMELVVLYDTGKIISQSASLVSLSDQIMNRLCNNLGVTHGSLIVYNDLSGSYEEVISNDGNSIDFTLGLDLISKLEEDQTIISYKDLFDETDASKDTISEDMSVLMSVPLMKNGKVYGAIILARKEVPFSDADINLVSGVSTQVSSAIENARHREEAEAMAKYKRRRV
ncbi:MAG: cyclic nucleotide-binding domain-containing protein [Candidatus Cloacimonetes bacterium]|nr:cyclic nucleotide-binding domain-containing protein [Candidatus Cloacimonadota bacterium]